MFGKEAFKKEYGSMAMVFMKIGFTDERRSPQTRPQLMCIRFWDRIGGRKCTYINSEIRIIATRRNHSIYAAVRDMVSLIVILAGIQRCDGTLSVLIHGII